MLHARARASANHNAPRRDVTNHLHPSGGKVGTYCRVRCSRGSVVSEWMASSSLSFSLVAFASVLASKIPQKCPIRVVRRKDGNNLKFSSRYIAPQYNESRRNSRQDLKFTLGQARCGHRSRGHYSSSSAACIIIA